MIQKPHILFLYTELAAYTVACFNKAAEHSIQLSVVRWPVNAEAPFEFNLSPGINVYNRKDYDDYQLTDLVKSINPQLVLTSGWVDRGYLNVCKSFKKQIPVVLLLDNPWKGNVKQWLASAIGRFKLQQIFTHSWVPGENQKQYAIKLGFKSENISTGFYSADIQHFNKIYQSTFADKEANFPRRFLFVGRYLAFKGIAEMWQAFIEYRNEHHSDWELWCIGTGDLYPERVEAPGIKHFGFIQPAELEKIIAGAGVFVLPSRKEPWGVVVHEYAASGFPLICSNEVGACEVFLKEGYNGFIHLSGSVQAIKDAFIKMSSLTPDELTQMGKRSHDLAQNISAETWVQTLLKFIGK